MAIENPFAPLTEQINVLAQQRGSPQNARLQFDLMNAVEEQTRQNLVNDYLATADFAKDPAAAMRTLGTLTNNMDMVRASLDYTLKNRAFEDQRKSLAALAQQQGEFGSFAETLAPGGFSPEEQAQLYSRAAGTGLELPSIPAGARPEGELSQERLQQQQLMMQGRALDIQNKQLELEKKQKLSELPFDLTPQGTDLTIKLQDRATKQSEDFQTIVNNISNIDAAIDRVVNNPGEVNRIATDQAVITSFNKILDPGSVVREGEYDRTQQNQAIVERAKGAIKKLGTGGTTLTQKDLIEIRDTAKAMAELRRQILNKKLEKIRGLAQRRGLNPDEVAPLFEPIGGGAASEQAPTTQMGITGGAGQPASVNDFFKSNPALRQFAK